MKSFRKTMRQYLASDFRIQNCLMPAARKHLFKEVFTEMGLKIVSGMHISRKWVIKDWGKEWRKKRLLKGL